MIRIIYLEEGEELQVLLVEVVEGVVLLLGLVEVEGVEVLLLGLVVGVGVEGQHLPEEEVEGDLLLQVGPAELLLVYSWAIKENEEVSHNM